MTAVVGDGTDPGRLSLRLTCEHGGRGAELGEAGRSERPFAVGLDEPVPEQEPRASREYHPPAFASLHGRCVAESVARIPDATVAHRIVHLPAEVAGVSVKVVAQHLREALVAPELAVEDVVIGPVLAEERGEGGGVTGLHGGGEPIEQTGEGFERIAHLSTPDRTWTRPPSSACTAFRSRPRVRVRRCTAAPPDRGTIRPRPAIRGGAVRGSRPTRTTDRGTVQPRQRGGRPGLRSSVLRSSTPERPPGPPGAGPGIQDSRAPRRGGACFR